MFVWVALGRVVFEVCSLGVSLCCTCILCLCFQFVVLFFVLLLWVYGCGCLGGWVWLVGFGWCTALWFGLARLFPLFLSFVGLGSGFRVWICFMDCGIGV